MMVRIGNFLFHYRNGIFPLLYLLLFVNGPTLFSSWPLAAGLGLVIAIAGQALRAVTIGLEYIIRGGRDRRVYAEKLVQGGIFAHCRNPLYVGNFLILLGVGVASNSVIFMALAIPLFIFAYAAIIAAEEDFLRRKFGAEFDAYCQKVNRLVPRLTGLRQTLKGMQFNWRRLVTVEYGSAYIWMAAIVLVALKSVWLDHRTTVAPGIVWMLCFLLLSVNAAYFVARYLKKSGLLHGG
jgi:protein-S-isoprenylcysteine O-methyltransferase Ste14